MQEFKQASSALFGVPWAMRDCKLAEIVGAFDARRQGRAGGVDFAAERRALQARRGDAAESGKPFRMDGRVAVIPIVGTLHNRVGFFEAMSGGASAQAIDRTIRAALADADVAAIALDVDSPGGSVLGPGMVAQTIFEARGKKPIVAVANDMAASAAYLIASAADKLVVSASSLVGSIGVYCVHEDWSRAEANSGIRVTTIKAGRWKAAAGPHDPLSEDGRTQLQAMVDQYYTIFLEAVARHRGMTAEAVRDRIAEGREWIGRQAIEVGAADEIGTLAGVVARLNEEAANAAKGATMSSENEHGESASDNHSPVAREGEHSDIRSAAAAAERERIEQIDALLGLSRLSEDVRCELRAELVDGCRSLSEARRAISAAVAASMPAIGDGGKARAIGSANDSRQRAMAEFEDGRRLLERLGVSVDQYAATMAAGDPCSALLRTK